MLYDASCSLTAAQKRACCSTLLTTIITAAQKRACCSTLLTTLVFHTTTLYQLPVPAGTTIYILSFTTH